MLLWSVFPFGSKLNALGSEILIHLIIRYTNITYSSLTHGGFLFAFAINHICKRLMVKVTIVLYVPVSKLIKHFDVLESIVCNQTRAEN
jgi:hypothetical protein